MHQGSFVDCMTERERGELRLTSRGQQVHQEAAPSCCRYGMNITAAAELRVWLEVPDTAWWLQLEIPDGYSTDTQLTLPHSATQWKERQLQQSPDNTLIFWATMVSFPSDPV